MKKIAVTKLSGMSATRIRSFYTKKEVEIKIKGLRKTILDTPLDTDRLLCMSNKVDFEDYTFYLTFDEVVIEDKVAYLITKKKARKGAKPFYFEKCKAQVALLGSLFEESHRQLTTVKVVVDSGRPLNKIDLNGKILIYILDIDGERWDIIPDFPQNLQWAVDKMDCISEGMAACKSFDGLPFAANTALEMET